MIKIKTARFKVNFNKIAQSASEVLGIKGDAFVDTTFLTEREIHALNQETRAVDKPTDVLSYPFVEEASLPFTQKNYPLEYNPSKKAVEIGCIAICAEYIEKVSKEDNTVYISDVYRAFTHGILHLLGYDHITSEQYEQMHSIENQIMTKAGLKI